MIKYEALILLANYGDFSETRLETFLTEFVNELPRSKLRGISSVEANIIRRGKPRGVRPD